MKVLQSLRACKSCRNGPKQCLTNLDSNAIKKCDPIGLDAMIKLTSVNYMYMKYTPPIAQSDWSKLTSHGTTYVTVDQYIPCSYIINISLIRYDSYNIACMRKLNNY